MNNNNIPDSVSFEDLAKFMNDSKIVNQMNDMKDAIENGDDAKAKQKQLIDSVNYRLTQIMDEHDALGHKVAALAIIGHFIQYTIGQAISGDLDGQDQVNALMAAGQLQVAYNIIQKFVITEDDFTVISR